MVYVKLIQDIYDEVKTSVKCVCEETGDFTMKVGVHQGLALNPYQFSLVMDKLIKSMQDKIPWFMYNMVLVNENINILEGKRERWWEILKKQIKSQQG